MPAPAEFGAAEYPWERLLGARPRGDGTVAFRIWAPRAGSISLRIGRDREVALEDAGYGVYEAIAPADAGDDYVYVIDGQALPDPASRSQPQGIRGPSRVVEVKPPAPSPVPRMRDLVIYELHIGTFTPQGTFEAAI